ncbi:hypothetical protein D3C71_1935620 [compost metagenome]
MTPLRVVTWSLRRPCSSFLKSLGMPPSRFTPRLKGMPCRLPFRSYDHWWYGQTNSLALPWLLRQNSAPRWAQRFSNTLTEPSSARETTTGVGPT